MFIEKIKSFKKHSFLFVLAFIIIPSLFCCTKTYASWDGDWGYVYTSNHGGGAAFCVYTGSSLASGSNYSLPLTIPDTLGGYPVVSIRKPQGNGFGSYTDIAGSTGSTHGRMKRVKTLTVPRTVRYIQGGGFTGWDASSCCTLFKGTKKEWESNVSNDAGYVSSSTKQYSGVDLSTSVSGSGTLTWTNTNSNAVSGDTQAVPGDVICVNATPAAYWYLASLTYSGGNISNGGTFNMPSSATTINATFAKNVYNVNLGSVSNGNVTRSRTTASYGDSVTITATPNAEYKLKRLYYTTSGSSAQTNITSGVAFSMPGNHITVYAEFEQKTYTATAVNPSNGTLQVSKTAGSGWASSVSGVVKDQTVYVNVSPSAHYYVHGLSYTPSGGSSVSINMNTKQFKMPGANVTVYADIRPISYTISKDPGITNGNVNMSVSSATYGQSVTVTANPNTEYVIDSLYYRTASGTNVNIASGTAFAMPGENITIYATFKRKTYTATAVNPSNGAVSVSKTAGSGWVSSVSGVPKDDTVYINATANAHYYVDELTYTPSYPPGSSPVSVNTATSSFTMPGSDVSVSAVIKPIQYAITVDNTLTLHGSIAAQATATYNESVTVIPTADTGYQLKSVTYTDETGAPHTIMGATFPMPGSATTVTAEFEPAPISVGITTVTDKTAEYGYTAGTDSELTVAVDVPDSNYTYTYQWLEVGSKVNYGGTPIAGETGTSLIVPAGKPIGYYYYYCEITATSNITGVTDTVVSDPATFFVDYITIPNADIKIQKPATGSLPAQTIIALDSPLNYTSSQVHWYDGATPVYAFSPGVSYRSLVTLNPKANYKFASGATVQLNGSTSGVTTTPVGNGLKVEYTFPASTLVMPAVLANGATVDAGYASGDAVLAATITNRDDTKYIYDIQWYEVPSAVNYGGTAVTEMSGKTLMYNVDPGRAEGQYYFYCEVTATEQSSGDTITGTSSAVTLWVGSSDISLAQAFVVEPEMGKAPDSDAGVISGSPYENTTGTVWYEDGSPMAPGANFDYGHTYTAEVALDTNNPYNFSGVTGFINAKNATVTQTGAQSIVLTYEFPAEVLPTPAPITSLDILVTDPKPTDAPSAYSAVINSLCVPSAAEWYNDSTGALMAAGEVFEKGKSYTVKLDVNAPSEYVFVSPTAVTINGMPATVTPVDDNNLKAELSFTMPSDPAPIPITPIDAMIMPPSDGGTPASSAAMFNPRCTCSGVEWYDAGGTLLPPGTTFADGNKYECRITVSTDSLHEFPSGVIGSINANNATITPIDNQNVTMSYTFELNIPAPTPSAAPSPTPSASPSATPSAAPSAAPSATPSVTPSATPSASPSAAPSPSSSAVPDPSVSGSPAPSIEPSAEPTGSPLPTYPSTSPTPTLAPSGAPAPSGTPAPSVSGSPAPSIEPSAEPTDSPLPTYPSTSPTPTLAPSGTPAPSVSGSPAPSIDPSVEPSGSPLPTYPSTSPIPTLAPSGTPVASGGTPVPSVSGSPAPSGAPAPSGTPAPSVSGSPATSIDPSAEPTGSPLPTYIPADPPIYGGPNSGLSTDELNAAMMSPTPSKEIGEIEEVEHMPYINGYPDGLFNAEKSITRDEVAQIFYNLLTDEELEEYETEENDYTDVPKSWWSNAVVSTITNIGLLNGDPDGSFRPNDAITRAELVAITMRYNLSGSTINTVSFPDITGHWAEEEIEEAARIGWIDGYPDGTFRPDAPITRGETVRIINNMLSRRCALVDGESIFPDIFPEDWYFADIREASEKHIAE